MELFPDMKKSYRRVEKSIVEKYVQHYQTAGFPYPDLLPDERLRLLWRLRVLDTSVLIHGERIESDNTAVQLANFYQPHRYAVRCEGKRTPFQIFSSGRLLREAIEKCYALNGRVTDAKLLSTLSIMKGARVAGNFPPGSAKAIYECFGNGAVWDMSAGFGGRMLGALTSQNVTHYIATEPCTKTCTGLLRMADEILPTCREKRVTLLHQGSEIPFKSEKVSLCFTSPPYFNTEKYSDEETQSYIRYPNQSEWLRYFLRPTFEQCYEKLLPHCLMVVNIADVSTFKDLERATIQTAEQCGFKLTDTKRLMLGTMPGRGRGMRQAGAVNGEVNSEPVFFFRKKDLDI